jgi:DNA-binding phage protein
MSTRPAELLAAMADAAKARFPTEAAWAAAAGLPKETLSRLKSQSSCDLRTLGALARAAGCRLVAVPQAGEAGSQVPEQFTRDLEDRLLDLAASGNADPAVWRAHGAGFFMGGLAVLLASARGFERERHLRLAEALHPGVSTPEVFGLWLKRSPLRAARFLPMAKRRRRPA